MRVQKYHEAKRAFVRAARDLTRRLRAPEMVDSAVIGETTSIVLPETLRSIGHGTGRYGFDFSLPDALLYPVNLPSRALDTYISSQAYTFGAA
jgi:hypothetical protein